MSKPTSHTRKMPSEWPALTKHAMAAVPIEGPYGQEFTPRQVGRIFRHVRRLSNEQRETNYYYGAGQIMCSMAILLREDHIRRDVVRAAALGMVEDTLRRRGPEIPMDKPFIPVIDDLHPQAMQAPFRHVAAVAQLALPPWHRALTDTLLIGGRTIHRQQPPAGFLQRRAYYRHVAEKISEGHPTAAHIAGNSLTGATAVLGALLAEINPSNRPSDDILARPITAEALEVARRSKVFSAAACLRLDEFARGAGWKETNGVPYFDAGILATPPPPAASPLAHHEGRLFCPAVQADGLALDIAQDILPSIIITAQHIVPGQHFRLSPRT